MIRKKKEFERMWKEAIMAQFELLSQHSIGRNEKMHEAVRIVYLRVEA
jgi:hypothetical protein